MHSSSEKTKHKPTVKRGAQTPRFAGEMLSVLSEVMSVERLESVLQKIAVTVAELFSIKGLFISMLDEGEQVMRIKAVYGYDQARTAKIMNTVYSLERLAKDLDPKWKVADNVYFIRPSPEDFHKEDEVFYFNPQNITKPRTDPDAWHEMDYLKLVYTDRDGIVKCYVEIEEPLSGRVFDKDTLEAMRIFSQLAGVAIENAKMYQGQLEKSERSKFLGDIIAHDINNYNQAVTSYLQMAQVADEVPEKVMAYLERASTSAWSISELIQRANKLTRIEEEGDKDLGPIELGEVLKETVNEVLREFPDRDVKINLKLNSGRYFVTGNELAEEIFANIIGNAVQYDPHEKVVVDVSIGEFFVDYLRYWCVSVADNGIGIPDSKKKVMFGRYSSQNEITPAGGLGLSIVRAVVQAYHGMVWVEDRVPGEHSKGSIFRVALPMTSAK